MSDGNVVGSAEFELRATTSKLKGDLDAAGRELRAAVDKILKEDLERGSAAMRRAFKESGQTEFSKAMSVIRAASEHTEKEVTQAAERATKDLKRRYGELGRDIGGALRGMSLAAQVSFAAITAYSVKLAIDAERVETAFGRTFGNLSEQAGAFATTLSDDLGHDVVELKQRMIDLSGSYRAFGLDGVQNLQAVEAVTQRAFDVAAASGKSATEVFDLFQSAANGSAESIAELGANIGPAAVKAELLRLGFKGNANSATDEAKAIARLNILLRQTADATGAAASKTNDAERAVQRAKSEFNNAARDLGRQLLPMMTQLFGSATNVLKAFNDLPGGVQLAGLAFLGLIAAGGPIAGLIANLSRVIRLARDTRLALIAAGAAGPAAGVGAGAGVAGGVAGATAPLAAGAVVVGLGTASFAPAPDDVKAYNADPSHPGRRFGESSSAWRARGGLTFREWQGVRSANQSTADLESSAAAAVTGQARAAGFTPPSDAENGLVTGFSLPPSLQTGTTSGGRRARTGPTEAELAAQREMLRLQGELDLLRAQGNEEGVRAKQREIDLVTLTKQYEAAGITNAADAAKTQVDSIAAAEDIAREIDGLLEQSERRNERNRRAREHAAEEERRANEILLDQLGIRAHLAQLEGDPDASKAAERRLWIEERINELLRLRPELTRGEAQVQAEGEATDQDSSRRIGDMREEFRHAFTDGIRAAIDGDLGGFFESLADRFTDRMLDNLADDLFNLLAEAAKGMSRGGEGGGWLSSIFSAAGSIFGGGRAAGGPVAGGMAYRIGEHGPETLLMPRDGFVIPNGAMGGSGGQARQVDVRLHFDSDFNLIATIDGRSAQVAGPIAAHAAATAYTASRNDQVSAQRRGRQRFV